MLAPAGRALRIGLHLAARSSTQDCDPPPYRQDGGPWSGAVADSELHQEFCVRARLFELLDQEAHRLLGPELRGVAPEHLDALVLVGVEKLLVLAGSREADVDRRERT